MVKGVGSVGRRRRFKDCGIGLDIWRTRKREDVEQRRESWKRERKKKTSSVK